MRREGEVSNPGAPPRPAEASQGRSARYRDVLFIHGWWAAGWVWSRVAERFEEAGYKSHALTLPGPESDRPSFSDHLDYALEVARSLHNPILVGHSVGGLLAMKMAGVVDPPACIAITPAPPAGVLPRPTLLQLRFLLAALPSMLLGRDFLPRDLLRRIDLNRLDPAEQDHVLAMMRPVASSQVRRIVPSLIRVDRRRLRGPILIVGACDDRLTSAVLIRAIARRYGADYREYRQAAHYILREPVGSEMTSDLIAWLAEKTGSPACAGREDGRSENRRD